MLFIIQQEWYRGIGDKLPSLRIEMEVFLLQKGGQDDGRISEVQTTVFFTTGAMHGLGRERIYRKSTPMVQRGFTGWQSGIDHTDESG